jgi:hypothetical protein
MKFCKKKLHDVSILGGLIRDGNSRRCHLCRLSDQAIYRKKYVERAGFMYSLKWLRKALIDTKLDSGWPDAERTELKIGLDALSAKQWIRFAWLKKYHGIDVQIFWAKSHEDAVYGKGKKYKSIEKYIRHFKRPDALILWNNLLRKVRR